MINKLITRPVHSPAPAPGDPKQQRAADPEHPAVFSGARGGKQGSLCGETSRSILMVPGPAGTAVRRGRLPGAGGGF